MTKKSTKKNGIAKNGIAKNEGKDLEQPNCSTKSCLNCDTRMVFKLNKKEGYYLLCPNCGYSECLGRRFLRFNRQFRQWEQKNGY